MQSNSDDLPSLDEIARLLRASQGKSVKITSGNVTVTVSPQLQLESVELGGPGVLPEHRAALQHDIIDAVTRAMRDVVTSSARMLEGQQESPDIRSMRAALQKELRRRSCSGQRRPGDGQK
jgi:DNA-binding protein YbaB